MIDHFKKDVDLPALTQDMDAAILKARAKQLAQPVAVKDQNKEKITVLEFLIMNDVYAVELHLVEAATRIGDIFPVPFTPRHIPGIIRRRGQTIALVSLERFFYPTQEGVMDMDFAIIVTVRGKRFALQAAEIKGVFHLKKELVQTPPDNMNSARAPYLAGITRDGLLILNLERIVTANGFGTQMVEEQ